VRQTLYEARLRLRRLGRGREIGWDEEIERRRGELSAIAPIPLAGALGGVGASKTLAASIAVKTAASIALTVTVVTVANRAGLVELPLAHPGGDKSKSAAVIAKPRAATRAAPGAMSRAVVKAVSPGPKTAAKPSNPRSSVGSHAVAAEPEADSPPSQGDRTPPSPSEEDAKQPHADEADDSQHASGAPDSSAATPHPSDESAVAKGEERHGGPGEPSVASAHGQETAAEHRPPRAGPPAEHGPPAEKPGAPKGESPGKPETPPGKPEATPEGAEGPPGHRP